MKHFDKDNKPISGEVYNVLISSASYTRDRETLLENGINIVTHWRGKNRFAFEIVAYDGVGGRPINSRKAIYRLEADTIHHTMVDMYRDNHPTLVRGS